MKFGKLLFSLMVYFIFLAGMAFAACTPGVTNGLCCIDGTQSGNCGTSGNYTGYYCNAPNFAFRASKCGCPPGYITDASDQTGANCKLASCPGGFTLNQCTGTKPTFCNSNGQLENKSSVCGCPTGLKPSNEGCAAKNCVDDATICSQNQTCNTGTSTCETKVGCQYNNPACGSGKKCNTVTGQCQDESALLEGCDYENPACGAGYTCTDNTCVKNAPADNGTGTTPSTNDAFVPYEAPKNPLCCIPPAGIVLLFGFVAFYGAKQEKQ